MSSDPFSIFETWFKEHLANPGDPETHAMILSTTTSDGHPSSRVVLLKGIEKTGFRFFTHYQSRKGQELFQNHNASLLFYWPELKRQIRIEGKTKMLSKEESDQYWDSRAKESQLSGFTSPQSHEISSRKWLEDEVKKNTKTFEGKSVPRPKDWGGYELTPRYFEFWKAGDFRLHDRSVYELEESGRWVSKILAP